MISRLDRSAHDGWADPSAESRNRVSPAPLISVVEDDDSLRDAIVGLVESLGYRSSGHASAEAFLDQEQQLRPDCIITDIQMGGLSGIDLKLRLTAAGVGTPVIMVTARTEPALHARARDSGAACVLQKPFRDTDLIGCIEKVLAA